MTAIITAITAHQAAFAKSMALCACDDEGLASAAVNTEEMAARALAETSCSSDDEFFAAAAVILARDLHEKGLLEHSDRFGSLAILLAKYLEKRAARTVA
jgi:hypothetical protein